MKGRPAKGGPSLFVRRLFSDA